jgi:hypothetical protein
MAWRRRGRWGWAHRSSRRPSGFEPRLHCWSLSD